jgi:methionine aminopeptidase
MSVGSRRDVLALVAAGRVVAEALARMRAIVRPGTTTAELDLAAAEVFRKHGARSAPQLAYRFPGVTCISVNDEAVHGIPGQRRIEPGDLVKLDVTAQLAGHGIGRTIHEPPSVSNFGAPGLGAPLTEGLVITIEPIVAASTRSTRPAGDGWTVATADGGRSAHFEHTIIVARGRPLILTA